MATSYSQKDPGAKIVSLILGIVFIIVITIICYVVGWSYSQTEGFSERTGLILSFPMVGKAYIAQSLSSLVAIIVYVIKFLNVAGRDQLHYRYAKTADKSLPFVYNDWTLFAVIAAVCTFAVSFVIYLIAFQSDMRLVAPLMLCVWLIQAALCVATFYIPLFKPLKSN